MKAILIRLWVYIGTWLGVECGGVRLMATTPVSFFQLASAVGDANVAMFVQKLDGWCKHNQAKQSIKHYADGAWWSYNSYPQWSADLGLGMSASSMRRLIEKAEKAGIVIGVQRVAGKPKWYRVDYDKLNVLLSAIEPANIVKFSGRGSVENERGSVENESTPDEIGRHRVEIGRHRVEIGRRINSFNNRFSQLFKPSGQQSSAPPSTLDGDDSKDKSIKEEGDDFEYSPRLVQKFGLAVVKEAYGRASVFNPRDIHAYVAGMLEPKKENPFLRQQTPPPVPLPVLRGGGEPHVRKVPVIQLPKSKEEQAWDSAMGQLQLQLDRGNWEQWVQGATFKRVTDGKYVVGVRNQYVRDMLQFRLYRNVRRVLSDVVGAEVEISFEVDETISGKMPEFRRRSG